MAIDTGDDAQTKDVRHRLARVETLVRQVESIADPIAREQVRELLQTLLDLHANAIDAMLEHVAATGPQGFALIDAMAADKAVSSVLLLHDLHPADLETRVGQALDAVRPLLRSHGGNVELVSLRDGILRIRMQGSCNGCASSSQTLKHSIEEAVYDKAPDILGIEVEGVTEPEKASRNGHGNGFVPVERLYGSLGVKVTT